MTWAVLRAVEGFSMEPVSSLRLGATSDRSQKVPARPIHRLSGQATSCKMRTLGWRQKHPVPSLLSAFLLPPHVLVSSSAQGCYDPSFSLQFIWIPVDAECFIRPKQPCNGVRVQRKHPDLGKLLPCALGKSEIWAAMFM